MSDDLAPYQHHTHPYSPDVDEYGITIPPCACGDRAIPGGRECDLCLIARVQRDAPFSPSWRRFPETPIPATGATT